MHTAATLSSQCPGLAVAPPRAPTLGPRRLLATGTRCLASIQAAAARGRKARCVVKAAKVARSPTLDGLGRAAGTSQLPAARPPSSERTHANTLHSPAVSTAPCPCSSSHHRRRRHDPEPQDVEDPLAADEAEDAAPSLDTGCIPLPLGHERGLEPLPADGEGSGTCRGRGWMRQGKWLCARCSASKAAAKTQCFAKKVLCKPDAVQAEVCPMPPFPQQSTA